MSNRSVIDLFCGCGGMSWGLHKEGFDIKLGVDINKKYIQTFAKNFGVEKTCTQDIREISGDDLLSIANLKHGELDFLIGGPPCQGFSKNTPASRRTLNSENNMLMREFLRIAEETSPNNIIIENVAEMKNGFGGEYTKIIENNLSLLGYHIIHHTFDASDYGVPQRRRRAFFLATKTSKNITISEKTHFHKDDMDKDFFKTKSKVSVWEAIGDLPSVEHNQKNVPTEYSMSPFSDYQKTMRGNHTQLLNHAPRELAPKQYARLSSLLPGQGLKDLPDELKVKGGYSGVYGRLTKDMIAPTITRWVFHPGSGRWGHPVDIRTITPREIARIQGFSDDYEFVGTYNDICGQLGNAVPALLMRAIKNCFKN